MELIKLLPTVIVYRQSDSFTAPTRQLVKQSPFWLDKSSVHVGRNHELLFLISTDGCSFDANKVPSIVLDETANGLTVTPCDFSFCIEFLQDEAAAHTSGRSCSSSILDYWSPVVLPMAKTASIIAHLAHRFGRHQLSRNIQNALLEAIQQQQVARRGKGPDYEQVYEQQRLQGQVARVLAEVHGQRERERLACEHGGHSKNKEEDDVMDVWFYDGTGCVEDHFSGEGEEQEDDTDTLLLPPILSPLSSHLYYSTSSRPSRVARGYRPTYPLPIMEPRVALSMPFMSLPMAVSLCPPSRLSQRSLSLAAASNASESFHSRGAGAPARAANSMVECPQRRQLVTQRLPTQIPPQHAQQVQPAQQPQRPRYSSRSAAPSAPLQFEDNSAAIQAMAARTEFEQTGTPHSSATRTTRNRDRDSLVARGRTGGRRPLPSFPRRANARRRWNPYSLPDPLAGLGYHLRDRRVRPSPPATEHTEQPGQRSLPHSSTLSLRSPETE